MQVAGGKRKFKLDDFATKEKANPIIQNITNQTQILVCICRNKNQKGQRCFKCNLFVHVCLATGPNRGDQYECASCLNKAMDPLFQVQKVLNQSYFRTQSIFRYNNIINFQFVLKPQDRQQIVQLRGLHSNATSLSWPMHGGFSINDQKVNFHELKPLLINSNRKARREEYFTIPDDKLKIGKNYLKFRIPCLDRGRFTSSYQYEQKKEYYFAVNLVRKLTPNELQTATFRQKRTEKADALQILKQNNSDVEVTQNKVNLMCPYTRQRVKVPIRGRYCRHFSCICLQTLVATHQTSRAWNCPLCDEKINEPYVDIWVYSMLVDNQKGSEVLVREDGSYEWIKSNQDDVMDLDDDSEEEMDKTKTVEKVDKKQPEKSEVVVAPSSVKTNEKVSKLIENVIDLDDSPEQMVPEERGITAKELKEAGKLGPSEKELSMERERQKKVLLGQIKQKIKKNPIPELVQKQKKIISENPQRDLPKPSQSVLKGKQQQYFLRERSEETSRKIFEPIVHPSLLLYDLKVMEVREMRVDEFRKKNFRGRENKHRKYIQSCQQLRRLFREVL